MRFETHFHTEKSNARLLDSTNKIKSSLIKANEMGLYGLAVTDHETLASAPELFKTEKELKEDGKISKDFKVSLGNEIYLVEDRDDVKKFYHFILIAKSLKGFHALSILSSLANLQGWRKGKMERVPTEISELRAVMQDYKGEVIAATACLGGYLQTLALGLSKAHEAKDEPLQKEIKTKMISFCKEMKEIFGDDFYIEISPADTDEQTVVNKINISLADSLGIKCIVGTDSHYLRPENRRAHSAFINSNKGKDREADKFYKYAFLQTESEIKENLFNACSTDRCDEFFANSIELANKIEQYNIFKSPIIPEIEDIIDYPKGNYPKITEYPNLRNYLDSDNIQKRHWVNSVLNSLYEKKLESKETLTRLEEETDVIEYLSEKSNSVIASYFVTFKELIDIFWECESICGTGRGSACGFLSCFLLDITQVNPMDYNLQAWRFLNKERVELPDIDTDLDPEKKELIFKKIREKLYKSGEKFYNKDYLKPFLKIGQFAQVATYGTAALKAAIQIAGRAWTDEEHPDGLLQEGLYLSSLISSKRGANADLNKTLYGDEESGDKPNYTFIKEIKKYDGLLENIREIEGLIKQKGVHAGGVIIFTRPFWEISPLMKSNVGGIVTQYDLHTVEEVGGLKFDFLSTRVPTKIRNAIKLAQKDGVIDENLSLREAYNKYLHPSNMDITCKEVYDEIEKGEIYELFQFSGSVGTQAAKLTKAKTVEELTAASALMRLMADRGEESQLNRFARFKNNISLWYEEMEREGITKEEQKILEKHYFYGLVPYQETFMMILMDKEISNFTLGEANNARKIISKKLLNKIPELVELFFSRVKSRNFAEYIYKTAIKPSLGYAFSINHSLPYSMIAVQEAIIYVKFGKTYWNTASLITEASVAEEVEEDEDETEGDIELFEVEESSQSKDIGKISRAILKMKDWGIKILPPDINKSAINFTPDNKNDIIYCGLSNIVGLNREDILEIMEKRPFRDLNHFSEVFSGNITKKLNCIRAGLFGNYEKDIRDLLSEKSPEKLDLNMRNAQKIITMGLFPKELETETKGFMLAKMVKKNKLTVNNCIAKSTQLEDFIEIFGEECLDEYKDNNGETEGIVNISLMENKLKKYKANLKDYLTKNKEEIVKKFNGNNMKEVLDKYYLSEQEASLKALGYYQNGHEFDSIKGYKDYGFANFFKMPEEPAVKNIFKTKEGFSVPLYEINRIAGTVIAKNDLKKVVTLLTKDGVVDVKIPAVEVYSKYKKIISKYDETTGKNKKIEPSWFERGTFLIVYGMRRGDEFVAKTYKNTSAHTINKFNIINGIITLASRELRDA